MNAHLNADDRTAFERLAREFAQTLLPGDSVALRGPLGAGKTTFVRAIVAELHGTDVATSPTFTFRHRYEGTPPIEHLDLYRIEHPKELSELGLHEAFTPDAIVLVEWPEHAPGLLPANAIEVHIEGAGEAPRRLTIESKPRSAS
ncbi:MAG TPA: tRNA (adenosine(37)-N6)-threonylcarbamoyltransferase complex ATPase subunit type 1 TsaE [Candidatus Baltobacteraceae bacterium]|jgi:tRNA threonylcarbamoyl adenosine modification protein YjeE|nr:tRNA (adenosine(37)-N6)-threonylcarbamoyltransferase complex ATPase subunit type 1 TsaE [Candidatus Baltobacteraceae bacterium]